MIVLKRRRGQSVRIGRAVVTVLGMGSAAVRLGIDAPPDVEVDWLAEFEPSTRKPRAMKARSMLARWRESRSWQARSNRDRTPPNAGWLAV